jgi:transcriptional regulator with XRE-family HTH domain
MKKSKHSISDWLDQYGDPEIDRFVEKNLEITEKVRNALILKGWNKGDLANAMGKSPSEVSKWLSGMHNLTLKSIIKMEMALDIELSTCTPISKVEYTALTIHEDLEYETESTDYTMVQEDITTYTTELAF